MPRLAHPPGCRGCVLDDKGEGFAPADGPAESWLLLVGEALGKVEALTGRPFMGDAGGMLTRVLNLLGWSRDALRIHNTISCHPPGDWFDERAPWYYPAMGHCPYLADTLNEGHRVVVPMGASALRRVLHLEHKKKVRVQDFHGAILRDPTDRFWVVPTYHPSFLQRGAHNLIGTVVWDLMRAEEARDHGAPAHTHSLVIDPPIDWFHAWVDQVVAARTQDPGAYPISSDVETPDKAGGKDEGEISADDVSFQLLRHNVACATDEGVTVPHAGPYLDELKRLYASPGAIWMWNREYDFIRQVGSGLLTEADSVRVVDLMWLWHFLQSDLPRGLGFVAPFYSSYGPWKHLADEDPAKYGAIDGLQTHRVGFGIIGDLIQQGMYRQAMRHTHKLLTEVLRPAQLVGVKVDRPRLLVFKQELIDKARERLTTLQKAVPDVLAPLTPKGGLVRPPAADLLHVKASAFTRRGTLRKGKPTPEIKQELYAKATVVERLVLREVLVCTSCGATDVARRHRCAGDASGNLPAPTARLDLAVATVRRWFWQEPFNPDSVPQVLAYIKHRKHTPGRAKKSQSEESTNRETLERLDRTTHDPFYAALLDYRAIGKVKGTYVEGTERRLDAEDRLHPTPTFKPSTMRLCIAAGTPIEIARDVAQYPQGILIEDVQSGMWAYTYDDDRRLTLRRVVSVARTGMKPIIRLHWLGGWRGKKRRFGYLDLTAEHEVRLTDGSYRRADLLRPGDNVLALSRTTSREGYQRLWATGHGEIKEHRFVHEAVTGQRPDDVHHTNQQRSDNRPENLEGMSRGAHKNYHASLGPTERQRAARRATMQRLHQEGRARPPARLRLSLTKEWLEDALAAADGHPTRVAKRHQIDYATLMQYVDQYGIVCKRKPRRKLAHNHTIVFVEPRQVIAPVYDLEIEGTHNFIASELCVHNSYTNPNITNVVADKGGSEGLAAGFRKCIVAGPGCRLLEVDFAAIEAVETGWCARDAEYYRLAKLGVHGALVTHVIGEPYDPLRPDAELRTLFKLAKKNHPDVYDPAKRYIHGRSYGLTVPGMVMQFPNLFPTQATAERYARVFEKMAPGVAAWQTQTQLRASRQHYLGGAGDHPFAYKHWFWSVYTYRRLTTAQYYRLVAKYRKLGQDPPVVNINGQWFRLGLGEDGKRVLAFYPQSIATGVLKEAMLRLFAEPDSPSYIGAAYFGRTPLRAPIHDSLLLEIPDRAWDRVFETVCMEMQRPVIEQPLPASWGRAGEAVAIGIAAKAGPDWQAMEEVAVPGFDVDWVAEPIEIDDLDDWSDLARVIA